MPRLAQPLHVLAVGLTLAAASGTAAADGHAIGNSLAYALPATGAAVAWLKDDDPGLVQLGMEYAAAVLVSETAKRTFGHTALGERPNGGPHSFPSGHATQAFAGAAFLERRYGWSYGAPAYLLASYCAYSRVEEDKHHWRDVIAGAALSIGLSRWAVAPRVRRVLITPSVEPGGAGLSLEYRW